MQALPIASVVIATRDRPHLLDDTVRSILEGDHLPAELVIIDQSREITRSYEQSRVRGCSIRHIRTASPGLSTARNLGARAARSAVVVFSDDDMLLAPTWLRRLVETLAELGPMTVVTGRVTAGAPERAGGFTPAVVTGEKPMIYEGRLPIDVLAGGNMALYRSAYEDVGGFDERLGAGSRYPAAEDNDFGFRLLERGFRIAYVPDAVAIHRSWRGRRDRVRLRWRYGRGKGGFYAKHASLADRHILRRATVDVGRRAVSVPRMIVTDPRPVVGDIIYSAGVISGMAGWLIRHRPADAVEIERRAVPE